MKQGFRALLRQFFLSSQSSVTLLSQLIFCFVLMSMKHLFSDPLVVHDDYFHSPNEFSDVKISFKHDTGEIERTNRGTHVFGLDVLLYANKAILSEASPIIKAFLAIEPEGTFFIDEDEEQAMVMPADVRDLLKFIYPQFTMKMTEQNSEFAQSTAVLIFSSLSAQVTGLIHLSEKYLIETLRNECKKYVYAWLHDLEMTNLDEKKDIVPRHILYKDGTRKHIASEIGKSIKGEKGAISPLIEPYNHLSLCSLQSE